MERVTPNNADDPHQHGAGSHTACQQVQKNSFGEKVMLCNHFTNLQPLLHEDNAWKGDFWSKDDEKYWHENIIFQPNLTSIYESMQLPRFRRHSSSSPPPSTLAVPLSPTNVDLVLHLVIFPYTHELALHLVEGEQL